MEVRVLFSAPKDDIMKNLRDTKRLNMIEQQIRTWDVLDERILDLYHQVEREDFVVDTAHRNLAYGDLSLPIGEGEVMLEPKLEARMLQILAPVAGEKILHVGAGSGFFAALLGRLAGFVLSVEISPTLAAAAQKRLSAAGINNVDVKIGDGAGGFADGAPFDAVVLTGSVPFVNASFFSILKDGGRLLAVEGEAPAMTLRLTQKRSARYFN